MSNFFFPSLSFNDWLKGFPCYDRLLSTPDTYIRRIFLSYWFTSLPRADVCCHCFGCGSGLDGILDVFFKGAPPHENEAISNCRNCLSNCSTNQPIKDINMPFPKNKVRFCAQGGSSPRLDLQTDPITGIVTERYVPNNSPLPSAEYNKIGNLVKAGVTLNAVPTNVVHDDSPDSFQKYVDDVFVKKADSSDVQPSNNKETK